MSLPAEAGVVASAAMAGGGAAYRYLQLLISDTHGSQAGFREVTWSDDGGVTEFPAVAMTGNSSPSPLAVSASSEAAGSTAAYLAYNDATSGNGWATTVGQQVNASLTLDLGEGNERRPNWLEYVIWNVGAPVEVLVRGSDDGAFAGEEEVIATFSGLADLPDGTVVPHSWS